MPPKKEVKQEKILLGRPGNSLKSGIVCEDLPTPLLFYISSATHECMHRDPLCCFVLNSFPD